MARIDLRYPFEGLNYQHDEKKYHYMNWERETWSLIDTFFRDGTNTRYLSSRDTRLLRGERIFVNSHLKSDLLLNKPANDPGQPFVRDRDYNGSYVNALRSDYFAISGIRLNYGDLFWAYNNPGSGQNLIEDALSKADTITGGKLPDQINGYGGNDKIFGNGGDDFIDGGTGNDSITGGAGFDEITGGLGNDRFVFTHLDGSTDTIIDFATGQDTLVINKKTFGITSITIGVSVTDDLLPGKTLHYNNDTGFLFVSKQEEPIAYFANLPATLATRDFVLI